MIRIYKHYEGEPGLHVLQDIERESWVMLIDPTQEELYQISESYRIDIDDLKAALIRKNAPGWKMKKTIR